jgi:hypothetical protein
MPRQTKSKKEKYKLFKNKNVRRFKRGLKKNSKGLTSI